MSSFLTEELGHRLNWLRDEQSRTNASLEGRIKTLETENLDIRNRLTVLTRLLIARQIASAEEIAMALAAASMPAASTAGPADATLEGEAPEDVSAKDIAPANEDTL
jgi:hypothetical protein